MSANNNTVTSFVLVYLPCLSASCSVLGSLTILYMLLWEKKEKKPQGGGRGSGGDGTTMQQQQGRQSSSNRKNNHKDKISVRNRILIGLSLYDLGYSSQAALNPLWIPSSSTTDDDQWWWTFGNAKTCTWTAAMAQLAQGAAFYNVLLSLYFYCAIGGLGGSSGLRGMPPRQFQRYLERPAHVAIAMFTASTMAVGVSFDLFDYTAQWRLVLLGRFHEHLVVGQRRGLGMVIFHWMDPPALCRTCRLARGHLFQGTTSCLSALSSSSPSSADSILRR